MKKQNSVPQFLKARNLITAVAISGFAFSCSQENIATIEDVNSAKSVESSARIQSQIWYGNPNNPYLESFYALNTEQGEDGSVVQAGDPTYGSIWKVNKPSGSKRAELSQTNPNDPAPNTSNKYIPSEGSTIYLGWRWKGNIAGSTFPDEGFAIFQNKSTNNGSQNYPFNMDWDGREVTLNKFVTGSGSQSSRKTTIWRKAISENQWVKFVMKVKFSKNASVGTLEFWYNGAKQTLIGQNNSTDKRLTHRTLDDEGNYFKWGAYNEASRDFNITVYLDEMRVASDLATAQPD